MRYDVVVIGGGIHGVGVAQAAAAHGYRVALVEQRGLAWGTSSRSSKLIHGGLRYLESAQYGVVRECLQERSILLHIAPDLVHLVPFYIPVYRDTHRRPWQIRTGLSLYAALTGMHTEARFRRVHRRDWDDLDGISTEGLSAVFQYWDAQTDDALLTRAVMRSAQDMGAELFMPAEFLGAELDEDGGRVRIRHGDHGLELETQVIVNAAGPWVNHVLEKFSPQPDKVEMDLVQGAHLVIDGRLDKGIYYMEAPRDHRAVFAMPWQEHLLLGTTETVFEGDPAAVAPLPQEQDYLLETLRHYFPKFSGGCEVLSSFAGLRVLPKGRGRAFGRSRETILATDRDDYPRVLSIYGGKLTAYRATAEKVMERVMPSLALAPRNADTREIMLSMP